MRINRRLTANRKIRDRADAAGVRVWEIAEEIGASESTVLRWLRTELDSEKAEKVKAAIDRIIAKQRQRP